MMMMMIIHIFAISFKHLQNYRLINLNHYLSRYKMMMIVINYDDNDLNHRIIVCTRRHTGRTRS